MKYLIIYLFSCSVAFSQIPTVVSGGTIEAAKINELINKLNQLEQKVVPLGTIFSSLLDEAQFQAENGNCWVKMNSQSIVGSDLAQVTGMTTLPNANGRFLRNIGGDAATLRSTQEDTFKSHDHGVYTSVNISQSYSLNSGSGYNQIGNVGYTGAQDTISRTDFQGSSETRPKNLSVNMFIKINRICQFN